MSTVARVQYNVEIAWVQDRRLPFLSRTVDVPDVTLSVREFAQSLQATLSASPPVQFKCPKLVLLHGYIILEGDQPLSLYFDRYGEECGGEAKLLKLGGMDQDRATPCCICAILQACIRSFPNVRAWFPGSSRSSRSSLAPRISDPKYDKVWVAQTPVPTCKMHDKQIERQWCQKKLRNQKGIHCLLQLLANKRNATVKVFHTPLGGERTPYHQCEPFHQCGCPPPVTACVSRGTARLCVARTCFSLFSQENALHLLFLTCGVMPFSKWESLRKILAAHDAASLQAVVVMKKKNKFELPLSVVGGVMPIWRFKSALTPEVRARVSQCAHGELRVSRHGAVVFQIPILSHPRWTLPDPLSEPGEVASDLARAGAREPTARNPPAARAAAAVAAAAAAAATAYVHEPTRGSSAAYPVHAGAQEPIARDQPAARAAAAVAAAAATTTTAVHNFRHGSSAAARQDEKQRTTEKRRRVAKPAPSGAGKRQRVASTLVLSSVSLKGGPSTGSRGTYTCRSRWLLLWLIVGRGAGGSTAFDHASNGSPLWGSSPVQTTIPASRGTYTCRFSRLLFVLAHHWTCQPPPQQPTCLLRQDCCLVSAEHILPYLDLTTLERKPWKEAQALVPGVRTRVVSRWLFLWLIFGRVSRWEQGL